jgi:hypothetical protein
MKHTKKVLIAAYIILALTGSIPAQNLAEKNFRYFGRDIINDIRNFYSLRTLVIWSASLSGSAMIAYSPLDPFVSYTYQEYIRGPRSDAVSRIFDPLGEWKKTWPVFFGCSVFDYIPWKKQTSFLRIIGNWGSRSSRALLLGWPSVALFQRVIGSPRPIWGSSYWQPFRYGTGVSGHAFVGAIPFLAAASMTENPWLKGIFSAASTGVSIGRINDNKHYASQVVLGWIAAWLSIQAISKTERSYKHTSMDIQFHGNGIRVSFNL